MAKFVEQPALSNPEYNYTEKGPSATVGDDEANTADNSEHHVSRLCIGISHSCFILILHIADLQD